jgi:hypothetical protein
VRRVALLAILVAGCGDRPADPVPLPHAKADYYAPEPLGPTTGMVGISDLYRGYEQNQLAAEARWTGKTVDVVVIMDRLVKDKDGHDRAEAAVVDGRKEPAVVAYVNPARMGQWAAARTGRYTHLRGRVAGKVKEIGAYNGYVVRLDMAEVVNPDFKFD